MSTIYVPHVRVTSTEHFAETLQCDCVAHGGDDGVWEMQRRPKSPALSSTFEPR